MKLPSIAAVTARLREIADSVDREVDVRLQVYEDGQWAIRWGLSDYDTDHHGYWGANSVRPAKHENMRRLRDVACDLLEQVREAWCTEAL